MYVKHCCWCDCYMLIFVRKYIAFLVRLFFFLFVFFLLLFAHSFVVSLIVLYVLCPVRVLDLQTCCFRIHLFACGY